MMENLVMKGIQMTNAPANLVVNEMLGLIESIADYNNSGGAIGYSVYYYFHNMYNVGGVRPMEVGGIPCTDDTIRDGSYPFTQDFYAIIRANEPEDSNTRKLFNLITGPEGAALMAATGYTPVWDPDKPAVADTVADIGKPAVADVISDTDLSGQDSGAATPQTSASITRATPQTSASIKSAQPKHSISEDITDEGVKKNIFPISFGNKIGFVNGDGELVVEPEYDRVNSIEVWNEFTKLYSNEQNSPLYYYASRFKRDERGSINFSIREYSAVIGPSGDILFTTADPDTSIQKYSIYDNSMFGYRDSETSMFSYLASETSRQFIVFADGHELDLCEGEEASYRVYKDGARVVKSTKSCYLINSKGEPISDAKYDAFVSYGADEYIFRNNGLLIAVDGDGKVTRPLPEFLQELHWVDSAGLYIYAIEAPSEMDGKAPNNKLYGLMTHDLRKITDARWISLYVTHAGDVFVATEPKIYSYAWWGLTYIIDSAGKRLSDKGYFTIDNAIYDYFNIYSPHLKNVGTAKYYIASPTSETYETGIEYNDIINDRGDTIYSYADAIHVKKIYGEYAVMQLRDDKDAALKMSIGLKRVTDTDTLSSLDDGWLIPPIYDDIYMELSRRFNIAIAYSAQSSERQSVEVARNAVYEADTCKLLFTGDYRVLNFLGYKYASTELSGADSSGAGSSGTELSGADSPDETLTAAAAVEEAVFFAATSLHKGFLNGHGEWIYSQSLFDTLKADD